VLSGERLIKIHAHRSDDIMTAVRLCDEYGLRFTLDHCTEGYLIADVLRSYYNSRQAEDCGRGNSGKGKLIGIITGPLMTDRSKPELRRSTIENPRLLAETGIPVAIATDHPVIPIEYLSVSAAMAVRAGMPEALALAAITTNAALCSDVGGRLGRLAPGYRADLQVLSGEPFDFRTKPDMVMIAGKMVFEHR
jgi:imidazolonepropionase-like amidohydrolase